MCWSPCVTHVSYMSILEAVAGGERCCDLGSIRSLDPTAAPAARLRPNPRPHQVSWGGEEPQLRSLD